ncbi:MAG TPA: BatA domain-containing protein [Chitinophaga sp.]
MLPFLQPIWLLGIAGISVPLFIHWWNHRQGKVLPVGSVALLRDNPRNSARSLRFSEWWLLLLRCLLIILLALLLAGPVWKATPGAGARQGWVLVSRPAAHDFNREIDSLVQAGFALHYFESNFPTVRVKELQASDTGRQNYWATLVLLQQRVLPEQPVYIFTDRLQRHFSGERPRVQLNLHWRTSLPDTGNIPPPRDTVVQHFTIWTGACPEDAQYVQAALLAIRQFSGLPMEIHMAGAAAALPPQQDWLFWLSDAPLPGVQAAHVLQYAAGHAQSECSWLAPGHPDLAVYQRVPAPEQGPAACWQDGFGYPLLTRQGTHYYAYTHFNPGWNDLPWSPQLPALLMQLMYPGGYSDRRAMPAGALQPLQVAGMGPAGPPPVKTQQQTGWLLFLILFVLERIMAGLWTKQKEGTIG